MREKTESRPIGPTSQTDGDKQDRIKLFEQRGIYRRYWDCSFEQIEQRGVPIQVRSEFAEVKAYAGNLKDNIRNGIGLILKGPVGTMKTSMAVAVLQKSLTEGFGGLFVPMASLLDNIFTLKAKSVEEWANYEQRIRETGLLVLDDLGAEHTEGWVKTKVDAIITERYNRQLPIIVTTNLGNKELNNTYAARVLDRLRSTAKMVAFRGESLRETA